MGKKREEERRILAELDEAVQKERAEQEREEPAKEEGQFHCRRCKAMMKNGVCPVCGHTMYVGMSEKERKKIRTIVTVVCLAIFLVIFLLSQWK